MIRRGPEVLDAEIFCEGGEQFRLELASLVGGDQVRNAKTVLAKRDIHCVVSVTAMVYADILSMGYDSGQRV